MVSAPSPPVPTMSNSLPSTLTGKQALCMALTIPAISLGVSPLARNNVNIAPTVAGSAPDKICFHASSVSSVVRSCRAISLVICGLSVACNRNEDEKDEEEEKDVLGDRWKETTAERKHVRWNPWTADSIDAINTIAIMNCSIMLVKGRCGIQVRILGQRYSSAPICCFCVSAKTTELGKNVFHSNLFGLLQPLEKSLFWLVLAINLSLIL